MVCGLSDNFELDDIDTSNCIIDNFEAFFNESCIRADKYCFLYVYIIKRKGRRLEEFVVTAFSKQR